MAKKIVNSNVATVAAKQKTEANAKTVREQTRSAAKPTKTAEKHPTPAELAASTPAPKAASKKEKKMGARDAYGFGENSETSWLLAAIASGKYTKAELKKAFVEHFTKNDPGGEKRKATSMSVFFSDVVKPFTTYHASRALIIDTDPKTQKLSLNAKRADQVREAIGQGLLKDLRGLNKNNHPQKINALLKKHNLPLLEVAK